MMKTRPISLTASLVTLFVLYAAFLWLAGDGRVSAVEPPEVRSAPEPYVAVWSTYVALIPPTSGSGVSSGPVVYLTTRSCRRTDASETACAGRT